MEDSRVVVKRVLLENEEVGSHIDTLAGQVASHLKNGDHPVGIVGIQTGGIHVARRILERLGMDPPPMGVLDITLYRDDIFLGLQQPLVRKTDIPFEVNGTEIILVDDVLYTGRTIRAALDALVDFGRPKSIRLAVLIDRGHREYPIHPDWVGKAVKTDRSETIRVELTETGAGSDRVVVYERED